MIVAHRSCGGDAVPAKQPLCLLGEKGSSLGDMHGAGCPWLRLALSVQRSRMPASCSAAMQQLTLAIDEACI